MSSYLNVKKLALGIRNNNPGNLVKTNITWLGKIPNGTDAKFEQFTSIEYGIRAMCLDLVSDIRKGKNTLTKLITEYAPPSENNTSAYIDKVAKSMGLRPSDELVKVNGDFLAKLARAIIDVENGKDAKLITDTMIFTGVRMVPLSDKNGVTVDTSDVHKPISTLPLLASFALFFFTFFSLTL